MLKDITMNTVEMIEIINKLKAYQCKQSDEIKDLKENMQCLHKLYHDDMDILKKMVNSCLDQQEERFKNEIADLKHQVYSMKHASVQKEL